MCVPFDDEKDTLIVCTLDVQKIGTFQTRSFLSGFSCRFFVQPTMKPHCQFGNLVQTILVSGNLLVIQKRLTNNPKLIAIDQK